MREAWYLGTPPILTVTLVGVTLGVDGHVGETRRASRPPAPETEINIMTASPTRRLGMLISVCFVH
jgi:hypothetical protein